MRCQPVADAPVDLGERHRSFEVNRVFARPKPEMIVRVDKARQYEAAFDIDRLDRARISSKIRLLIRATDPDHPVVFDEHRLGPRDRLVTRPDLPVRNQCEHDALPRSPRLRSLCGIGVASHRKSLVPSGTLAQLPSRV